MKRILSAFLLILLLPSCSDDGSAPGNTFDRPAMLQGMTTELILPAFSSLSGSAFDFTQAVNDLKDDPSTEHLEAAQSAWEQAVLDYKFAEMYMMGPMDQQNAAAMLDNWPTNVAGIEEELERTTPITPEYIQQLGSTRKGFPAAEYILFDPENNNEAVIARLNGRTLEYLSGLAEDILRITAKLESDWSPDGGNYAAVFRSATGTDAASSINVLANELVKLTEVVKNEKLGIPLGKKSMGVLLPENVEARFSSISIKLALRNLDAIEAVFTGNDGTFPGYQANLEAVGASYNGAPLGNVIREEIDTFRQELLAINGPLRSAVENDYQQVERAYNSAQRLVVLLKTDMISSLGLLITFTDNDGD